MVFIAVVHILILNFLTFVLICISWLLYSDLVCNINFLVPHLLFIDTIQAMKYLQLKIILFIFCTAFSWMFSLVRSSNSAYFLCCPGFVYSMILAIDFTFCQIMVISFQTIVFKFTFISSALWYWDSVLFPILLYQIASCFKALFFCFNENIFFISLRNCIFFIFHIRVFGSVVKDGIRVLFSSC